MLRTFASDATTVIEVMAALWTPASLRNLNSIHRQGAISAPTYEEILTSLARKFWPGFSGRTDFVVCIADLVIPLDSLCERLQPELLQLAERWFELVCTNSQHEKSSAAVIYFLKQGWVAAADPRVLEWIRFVVQDSRLEEDLTPVSEVIQHIAESCREDAALELGTAVINDWKKHAEERVREDGLLAEYNDVERDLDQATVTVAKYVERRLADYPIDFDETEIREIVTACDIRGIVEENENSYSSDNEGSHYGASGGLSGADTASIDDLFDRNR